MTPAARRDARRSSVALPLAAMSVAMLPGCLGAPADAGFGAVNRTVHERTGYAAAWTRGADEDAEIRAATQRLLEQELTLDRAVRVALLNNRHLQATFEQLGIARGQLLQAGVPENPVLGVEARFFDDGTAIEGLFAQDVLSILLIPLRRGVHGNEFEATRLLVTERVIALVGDVKRAHHAYQAEKQVVALLERIVQATKSSYMASARLREAGNVPQLHVLRERALYEEAKVRLNAAVQALVDARERLNVLLGLWGARSDWETPPRMADVPAGDVASAAPDAATPSERGVATVLPEQDPPAMPGEAERDRTALDRDAADHGDAARARRIAGPPGERDVTSPAERVHGAGEAAEDPTAEAGRAGAEQRPSAERFHAVERLAIERSLRLAAERHHIEAQASRVDLHTIREIFPFVDLGITAERDADSGEWGPGPGLRIPIPLWDFAQGTYPRELSRLRQRVEEYAALATDVRAVARAAESRLQTARERARYHRDVIVPLHTAIVAESQQQYNAMQLGPFELLLAKQQQIAAATDYVAALLAYWLARADLEQLLDGSLPDDPARVLGGALPADPMSILPMDGDQRT